MAEQPILSVIGTVKSRLPDISIKDGQLIFVQDSPVIVLDLQGKRNFYNQVTNLSTETERQELLAPIQGAFYFVVETAILWTYQSNWVQITTPPHEVVFIGTVLPKLGNSKTLYVDKNACCISVWDDELARFQVVANKTDFLTNDEIDQIVNN